MEIINLGQEQLRVMNPEEDKIFFMCLAALPCQQFLPIHSGGWEISTYGY